MTLALIGNLDTTELIVVVIAAVLIFGKRLPQVAAQAGAQIGKLRRQLDTAWRDSGVDKEVREVQRSIDTLRDAIPRDLSAGSLARTAANEFQRRVDINQSRLEETASATAEAAAGTTTQVSSPELSTPPVPVAPAAPAAESALTDPIVLPRSLPQGVEARTTDGAAGESAPSGA
ncbi:MAG: twin-arginine translocase TatA/TatE family subunit [Planctomycetes bacterium]|nr:twin-arginine translocase TatA/TatE family subunit [Planctomycetota bacterium]